MGNGSFVLGMDIGGTNVRMGLIDKNYNLVSYLCVPTERIFTTDSPAENLNDLINDYIGKVQTKYSINAISMGFPSTINKQRDTILSTPNIKPLQNINIVNQLKQYFDIPIYINRDVNFLMLHDIHKNGIISEGITIGLYFGTGLGNAVCIDGKILIGQNGVAAELGHIPVLGSKVSCSCGNEGCLEMYASGKYLEKLVKDKFSQIPIKKIFTEAKNTPEINQFIDYLAIAVATEVTLLDPSFVILGGGVLQMKEFPKEQFEHCIKKRVRKPLPCEALKLIYSQEAQENGVIGAGIYAYQMMREDGII